MANPVKSYLLKNMEETKTQLTWLLSNTSQIQMSQINFHG